MPMPAMIAVESMRFSSESSQMISGCRQSTAGGAASGCAFTLPAPMATAARVARTRAPNMPVSPPTAVIVPKSPLCAVLRWRRAGGHGRAGGDDAAGGREVKGEQRFDDDFADMV